MNATIRSAVALVVAASIASTIASCGGSKSSPLAPTAAPASVVASLAIAPLSATRETTATGFLYRITFQIRETSGRSTALLTGVSFGLSVGGSTDPSLNGAVIRIPAGGAYNAGTIRVTDDNGRGPSTRVTVNVAFSDDAGTTASTSATTDVVDASAVPPPTPVPNQTFTITGTITDGTSRGVLPNIAMELADANGSIRPGLTSSAGTFSFSSVAGGTYTVTATATSYLATSRSVTVSSDTRIDFVLQRTAPTPPPGQPTPPPGQPPALTCNGATVPSIVDCLNNLGRLAPTARCNDGAYSCASTRSGTCSGHQGVSCYVCPGPLC